MLSCGEIRWTVPIRKDDFLEACDYILDTLKK